MKIQLNTDTNISGRDEVAARVEQIIEDSGLSRFGDQLTRLEVHLSDVNSTKGGFDKRCVIEARPEHRPPVSATEQAADLQLAIKGAANKLVKALDTDFGRLGRNARDTVRGADPG